MSNGLKTTKRLFLVYDERVEGCKPLNIYAGTLADAVDQVQEMNYAYTRIVEPKPDGWMEHRPPEGFSTKKCLTCDGAGRVAVNAESV